MNGKDSFGWAQLGRTMLFAGRYDSALTYLRFANALNPGSYHILMSLGQAQYRADELQAARRSWTLASSIDSSYYDGHAWLGRLAERAGDWEKAVALYERSISKARVPGWVFTHYGSALLSVGDTARARTAFAKGLARGENPETVKRSTRLFPEMQRTLGLDTLDLPD